MHASVRESRRRESPASSLTLRDEFADSTPPPQPALADALRPVAQRNARKDDFRIYRGSNHLPQVSTGRCG